MDGPGIVDLNRIAEQETDPAPTAPGAATGSSHLKEKEEIPSQAETTNETISKKKKKKPRRQFVWGKKRERNDDDGDNDDREETKGKITEGPREDAGELILLKTNESSKNDIPDPNDFGDSYNGSMS